jgi:Ion channel
MRIVGLLVSVGLILGILIDAFESILQPRRVTHRFRFARLFYRSTWMAFRDMALLISPGRRRQAFLALFGPLSLLGLFATWIFGLIFGFALFHWSLSTALTGADAQPTFLSYLYLSGTTFVTLGYGDITPTAWLGRALSVIEAGLGFGFLAVIVSYLPVLYQAFSRREVSISLLDARAGSPPSASQILLRLARSGNLLVLDSFLAEWERWAAELLESHLSFPVLSYYRSQHDNQSWLAALVAVLDTCTILMSDVKGRNSYQAQLTFAMARHAAVDLALILKVTPRSPKQDRLSTGELERMRKILRENGLDLRQGAMCDSKFNELRGMYEPFVDALGARFLFDLPPIMVEESPALADNWQRSAWMQRTPGIGSLPVASVDDEHFR